MQIDGKQPQNHTDQSLHIWRVCPLYDHNPVVDIQKKVTLANNGNVGAANEY